MKKLLVIIAMLLFVVSATRAQDVMTNDDVIALSKSGLGPDIVIAKIKASAVKFDTSTAALLKLKEANVDDEVIAAMVNKEAADKEVLSDVPEQGTLKDLTGKKKFYVYTEYVGPLDVVGKITQRMTAAGYTPVQKIEDADFAMEWEQVKNPGDPVREVVGILDVMLVVRPSGAFRKRKIYSVRKQAGHNWFDWVEPVDQAMKQFLKDLDKAVK